MSERIRIICNRLDPLDARWVRPQCVRSKAQGISYVRHHRTDKSYRMKELKLGTSLLDGHIHLTTDPGEVNSTDPSCTVAFGVESLLLIHFCHASGSPTWNLHGMKVNKLEEIPRTWVPSFPLLTSPQSIPSSPFLSVPSSKHQTHGNQQMSLPFLVASDGLPKSFPLQCSHGLAKAASKVSPETGGQ